MNSQDEELLESIDGYLLNARKNVDQGEFGLAMA